MANRLRMAKCMKIALFHVRGELREPDFTHRFCCRPFLQGVDAAAVEISRDDDPCSSVVSWMKVMTGAENDAERYAAKTLFESMRRVELSAAIAHRAVDLRRRLRLKLPDAIVLATADREGCILVTRHAKDFDPQDPRVRIPYAS